MPRVSVVIPNYNHAPYLDERLGSVLDQTYRDFEVIILDDKSSDNSREVLKKYRHHPRVSQIIYNEYNSGTSYKQWYKGIQISKGELIWIAESDDWCDEHFLELTVPCFEDENVVLAYTSSQFIYDSMIPEKVNLSAVAEYSDGIEFIRNEMLAKNKIFNASMAVFRKSRYNDVKELGFLDFKLCGDWMLWTQIINRHKIAHIPEALNYCRRHPGNLTGKLRKDGLDFIEGLEVLKTGKKYCNNNYPRLKVYAIWRDRFLDYRKHFSSGTNQKVMKAFLKQEPPLYLYLHFKKLKKFLKKLILGNR